MPRPLRAVAGALLPRLPRNESLKRGLYALDVPDRLRRYQNVFSIQPADVIDGLFQPGMLEPGAGDAILNCWGELQETATRSDELTGFQWLELQSSLPDELLMYGDKMSMAHGLEVRVPYLDRTIVEYTQRLDATLKIRWGLRKYVHRRVSLDFLPSQAVRGKKRGFAVNVVDAWFQRSLSTSMDTTLLDGESLMYGFLDVVSVQRLLDDHRKGVADNHKLLFSLVVLEQWLRANDHSPMAVTH